MLQRKEDAPDTRSEPHDPVGAQTIVDLERAYSAPFPAHWGARVDRAIFEHMHARSQIPVSFPQVRTATRVTQFIRTHWRMTQAAASH
jgi:hypothetical protein